jgi:hypothetical protein
MITVSKTHSRVTKVDLKSVANFFLTAGQVTLGAVAIPYLIDSPKPSVAFDRNIKRLRRLAWLHIL